MFIPNERVYREIRAENASLWFVPANEGTVVALLVKAPSSTIKAIITGCPVRLLFGKTGPYLSAGIRIFDTPDSPILISGSQRQEEENQALVRALLERRLPIHLFNEMDVCQASSTLECEMGAASQAAQMVGDVSQLYVGPFTSECSHALDCFCYSTGNTELYPGATSIPLVEVPTTISPWQTNQVSFLGAREQLRISIGDRDEGEMLERAVWASLESVFPLTLYKSPQVKIGNVKRELTDVLAFYERGTFLIETKDLSILQAGFERDGERRLKGVQKQVKKAIAQLVGASKAVSRGDYICDTNNNELFMVRDEPAHCIVLVTELMHSGDWSEIEEQLIQAMDTTGAFFSLIDLSDFIRVLKGSNGQARHLDDNLVERCKLFGRTRSVHIRFTTHHSSESGIQES